MSERTLETPTRQRNAPLWPLAALLALHVLLWTVAGPGFMASDDLSYARAAHRMATGTFVLAEAPRHWDQRLGVVVPTALVYRLLGTGGWQTVVYPLLVSLSGISAAYLFLRTRATALVALAAALVIAAAPATLVQSTLLLPDNAVGITILVAAFLTLAGRPEKPNARPVLLGCAAALVIAFAVTVKLTSVWAAPPFVVLLVRDLIRRRHLDFWGAFATTGAVAGGAYFAMYHFATGDALFRIHVIEDGHNQSHWALAGEGASAFVHRLLVEPGVLLMGTPEFTGLLAFALPTAAACFATPRGAPRRSVLLTAIAATLLAMFFFGSTSLRRFAPMPLLPRMLVPVVPFLAVLAVTPRPHAGRARAVGLALGGVLLVASAGYAVATGHLLQALVPAALLALHVAPARTVPGRWRPMGLGLILLATTLYGVARGGIGETPPQRAERDLPRVLAERVPGPARILCSVRAERGLEFRYGWEVPERLTLLPWEVREPPFEGVTHVLYVPGRPTDPTPAVRALLDAGEVVHEQSGVRLVRMPPR